MFICETLRHLRDIYGLVMTLNAEHASVSGAAVSGGESGKVRDRAGDRSNGLD